MKRVKDRKDVSIMSPQDEQWRRPSLLCILQFSCFTKYGLLQYMYVPVIYWIKNLVNYGSNKPGKKNPPKNSLFNCQVKVPKMIIIYPRGGGRCLFNNCKNALKENIGLSYHRGNTLQWFESYLRGRGQKVYINGTFSEILEIGLVQGLSLSCLLFIIYVNDFFQSNILFSVAFADVTNVASKCKNSNTRSRHSK